MFPIACPFRVDITKQDFFVARERATTPVELALRRKFPDHEVEVKHDRAIIDGKWELAFGQKVQLYLYYFKQGNYAYLDPFSTFFDTGDIRGIRPKD